MWIFSCRSAVLFDALLHYAVRYGEHLIHKVGEALVFDVTLCVLGGRFRVTRQNLLPESELRRRAFTKSILVD